MRRLSLLLVTFCIAWLATSHIANVAEPSAYILRDSLLITTLAALIFNVSSSAFRTHSADSGQAPHSALCPPLSAFSILICLLAVALRFWRLTDLPADCMGEECVRALQLATEISNGATGNSGMIGWLAGWFWQLTQDGLFSLRLAGVLIGSGTVLAFYGAASQIATPPGALIGTLLLAINPWHLWLSRSADPSGGLILAITLLLWAALALAQQRTPWLWLWLALATLPLILELPNLQSLIPNLLPLFHSTPTDLASPFTGSPLLPPLLSALAICGLGVTLRNLRQLPFAIMLTATTLIGGAFWLFSLPITMLLPVAFLLATLAIDALMNALLTTWRPLFQPATLFATALIAFLLIGGRSTVGLFARLDGLVSSEANAVNGTMARYLLEQNKVAPATLFFVPPSLRFDSAARLLAGDLLQSTQVCSIDPSTLPFSEAVAGDVLFLLPVDESPVLFLLQRIYPLASLEAQFNADGALNFNVLRLSPAAIAVQQPLPPIGLTATYFPGEQAQGIALAQRIDPLPGYPADLPAPYSVLWTGKLAAVRSGETLIGALTDGTVSVAIDGVPLIESVKGEVGRGEVGRGEEKVDVLHEGARYLERGWHLLEIRYTPSTPFAPLRLYWQPPGSRPAPLSSDFLYPNVADQPTLPTASLLPLTDERLGSSEGFALTTSIDLWQTQPSIANLPAVFNLPPLVVGQVWQVGAGCGAGEGQLNRPHGVAIDAANGRILVADTDNRRIVAYSLAGQMQESIVDEAFQELVDVAVEPTGALLALDAQANGIFRIEPGRNASILLALDTTFYRPRGFAVDSAGQILVADTGGARVVVLNAFGQMLGEFGGQDKALGKGQPVDAVAMENLWWAISAENGRVWNLATLGSLGALAYNNTLDGPQMAILPDASFFVSDPAHGQILYFASTGQPLRTLSGQHAVPTGIAVAVIEAQSYLAVVDTAACSLTLWRVLEL